MGSHGDSVLESGGPLPAAQPNGAVALLFGSIWSGGGAQCTQFTAVAAGGFWAL
jgi:hypothetical protein